MNIAVTIQEMPEAIWRGAKAQAALDGVPIRLVVARLLAAYVAHQIPLPPAPKDQVSA